MNMFGERLNKLIESGVVKEVLPLSKENPIYVVGQYYWDGCRCKYYHVDAANYEPTSVDGRIQWKLTDVTVTWEDGLTVNHDAPLSRYDYQLIMDFSKEQELFEELLTIFFYSI